MVGLLSCLSVNLTIPYTDERRQQIEHTHEWMASCADPSSGKSCRECRFWGRKTFDYEGFPPRLAPKRCYKATSLMRGKLLPAVPFNAFACRFFEPGENRPTIERPPEKPMSETEIVTVACPRCGKPIDTLWMKDNTGMLPGDFVLAGDAVFHN